jgi:hypothetical protein
LEALQLSAYGEVSSDQTVPSPEVVELEISKKSEAGLFAWTLTHPSRAFSEIEPVFNSKREFLEYVETNLTKEEILSSYETEVPSKIVQIAIEKISREWNVWVNLHTELPFDERKLDNMLMAVLYRIILDRDLKRCVLCQSMSNLTIHHIIQKRRNVTSTTPPFGRSVPTNLITLCRDCHSVFDPMILV